MKGEIRISKCGERQRKRTYGRRVLFLFIKREKIKRQILLVKNDSDFVLRISGLMFCQPP